MEEYKVTIYNEVGEPNEIEQQLKIHGDWCVEVTGDNHVYVYPTKRSALRKVEALLDEKYK